MSWIDELKKRRWQDNLIDGFASLIAIGWIVFILKLIYEVIK